MINRNLKKFSLFLFVNILPVAIGLFLVWPKEIWASDLVVFEYPPNDTTVVEKSENVVIKGFVKKNTNELASVQISFDGQIWRNVVVDKNNSDSFYHWHYPWTAAGKGKNFIQISIKDKKGEETLALKMIEVKPKVGEEEDNLREMLENYKQEIMDKNNKVSPDVVYKDDIVFMIEYILNKNFGDWIDKNWGVLLFGKENLEYCLNLMVKYYNFVRKYPIGIDLVVASSWPILIFDVFITVWLIIFGKILSSLHIFQAKFANARSQKISKKTVTIFDVMTLEVVSLAKMSFKSSFGREYVLYANEEGKINLEYLPSETYTWTNLSKGYKNYILESISQNTYRQKTIAKDNIVVGDYDIDCAIAAMPIVGQERASKFTKANFLFPSQKWLINNFTWLAVWGIMAGINLYYFQPQYSVLIITCVLVLGLFVNYVLSPKKVWGVMRTLNGTRLAWKMIVLKKEEEIFAKTWTDWEGKFSFKSIPEGNYQILAQRNEAHKKYEILVDKNGQPKKIVEVNI